MQQHINYSSLQVRDETVTKVGYESRIVNAFSLFLHTLLWLKISAISRLISINYSSGSRQTIIRTTISRNYHFEQFQYIYILISGLPLLRRIAIVTCSRAQCQSRSVERHLHRARDAIRKMMDCKCVVWSLIIPKNRNVRIPRLMSSVMVTIELLIGKPVSGSGCQVVRSGGVGRHRLLQ